MRSQARSGSGADAGSSERRVVGSTALYSRRPPRVLPNRVSNSPLVAVARYGAIGSRSSHSHVVRPRLVLRPSRIPLAIASMPAGTVTSKSYVALSFGESFTGYQPGDPCGSLTTNAPSWVGIQPSIELSGSTTG